MDSNFLDVDFALNHRDRRRKAYLIATRSWVYEVQD